MLFEWEEAKNSSNLRKHVLSFELVRSVFADPLAIIRQDPGHHGADRWRKVGTVGGLIVALMVFTLRESDTDIVRIISARRATRHEREEYEEG